MTDAVGVDEPDIEDEGDEVVVEDHGLESEIRGDEDPGCEDGQEPVEGLDGVLASFAADVHDVHGAARGLVFCVLGFGVWLTFGPC